MRWGAVAGRSPRRARRRTLFSATAASGPPTTNETDEMLDDDQVLDDLSLAQFVVDNDDYPAVIPSARPVMPASVPDRVDDIDQWLEEFAVSD